MNWVKFLRGTPAAYAKIENKDSNTLYFISEKGATTGSLYLGDKLISASIDLDSISIEDFKDVNIDNTSLVDGQVLMYDYEKQEWVNKSLGEIVVDTMQGATSTTDGAAGLVPAPLQGQETYFLRGDGTWAVAGTSADVSALQATVTTLVGEDTGKSVRDIAVAELTKQLIPENAQESLDTLQEIADWIQQHPSDVAAMNTSITNLETRLTAVEGDYVTNTVYSTQVGDLSQLLSHKNEGATTSIVEEINNLTQRLEWQDMTE